MSHPPQLFTPIKVGPYVLQHRIVLAPLTRMRATLEGQVPINPRVKTYYSQRAARPGTLLISEATFVSPQAGGYDYMPGIWNKEQIDAWKEITDAVHGKGSIIFLQIAALGRAAKPEILKRHKFPLVGPSPIPVDPKATETPRELTIPEIKEYIQWFAQAARNAIEGAGFDGIEIHCANGSFLDQFLQDVSNQRTDDYGGSIENRSRLPLEVVHAIAKAIGEEKIGVRISPWTTFQSMGMEDPIPQYTHFAHSLRTSHPDLAYLHVTEADSHSHNPAGSNDFLRDIWQPKPFIACGEYTRQTAIQTAQDKGNLISFGRLFISNPDLPTRLEKDIPLTPPDSTTFYTQEEEGYTTYSFADVSK